MDFEEKLEKDAQWILPAKLKLQEVSERNKSIESSNLQGDFGSYKALLGKKKNTMIEYHNSVGENARIMAVFLKTYINKLCPRPEVIGDMGCGAGSIAHEMKILFPKSQLLAYDISEDAIAYGKRQFTDVEFIAKQIEPDSDFDRMFDVIYAHEFYPFTRTNSFDFQKAYISNFLRQLQQNANGLLLISLVKSEHCLLNNFAELVTEFGKNFEITISPLPIRKVKKIFGNFALSLMISRIINLLFRRKSSYMISLRKK